MGNGDNDDWAKCTKCILPFVVVGGGGVFCLLVFRVVFVVVVVVCFFLVCMRGNIHFHPGQFAVLKWCVCVCVCTE